MRYGSVQNAEIHLFCSENRNFLKKYLYICIDLKVNRIEMEVSNNGS